MIDPSSLSSFDAAMTPVAGWLGTFALHSTVALGLTWIWARLRAGRARDLEDRLLRQALWLPLVSATVQFLFVGNLWSTAEVTTQLTVDELAPLLGRIEQGPPLALDAVEGPEVTAFEVPWAAVAVGAAGVAACFGLAWLWRTYRGLRRILADRRPETDPRVLGFAAELAGELGLRQSPGISRADALATPIAFGFVRPEVCLPARAARLDDGSLRAMLGHELAHLRRRDPVWMWLGALMQALFPWQLMLLAVRRQWTRIVELRCDAEAAHHTSPTAVARCLVEVAEWLRPRSTAIPVALGMAARSSALRERVEAALAAGPQPTALRRTLAGGLAALSLTTLTLAAPGLGEGARPAGTADDFTFAMLAPDGERAAAAARIAPFVALVEQEYTALVAEADALRQSLRAVVTPSSLKLQDALQRRLTILEGLRRRIHARAAALHVSHSPHR